MSYDSLLIHTCTTRRYPVAGAADAYGTPATVWANKLENQPCRLVAAPGTELKVGAEIVVADYKLFVKSIDITEQDRVVIGGLTYEILLVQDYADSASSHHKQCWLRISR